MRGTLGKVVGGLRVGDDDDKIFLWLFHTNAFFMK